MTQLLVLLLARQSLAVSGAIVGAYLAVSRKSISHRTLCLLISFAAGSLLAVSLFDIVPEAIELVGWTKGLASLASGYALFWFVTRFISHVCPACSATHAEVTFKNITFAMVAALALHSVMDGLAIYSSLLSSSTLSLELFIAVLYHKLPEGMALTLVARGSGLSRLKSFGLTAMIELLTTFGGGFAGMYLVPETTRWTGLVLGHVGGGFIYIVIHALLSEVFKHHPRSTIVAAMAGAGSIFLIGFLAHAH